MSQCIPTRRARGLAAVLAAGALALLGLNAPATQAAPAKRAAQAYVAMGDSVSAGSGILPLDPAAAPLCLRTTANFPHVLAARTGLALTDVSCGGAETKDFTESQHPGVAPQSDALSGSTGLVTMTIGANDADAFIDAVVLCGSAGLATLGSGHPCQSLYGSAFDDRIDTSTYQAVKSALAGVRAKAPNARVAILGYPWILPAAAVPGCFAKLPIAAGDVPYLRDLQTHLNAAVRRAATETGVTYVDVSGVSEGHDACQPVGTRWIEPILTGTNFVPVHPNALGESKLADRTAAVLGLG